MLRETVWNLFWLSFHLRAIDVCLFWITLPFCKWKLYNKSRLTVFPFQVMLLEPLWRQCGCVWGLCGSHGRLVFYGCPRASRSVGLLVISELWWWDQGPRLQWILPLDCSWRRHLGNRAPGSWMSLPAVRLSTADTFHCPETPLSEIVWGCECVLCFMWAPLNWKSSFVQL